MSTTEQWGEMFAAWSRQQEALLAELAATLEKTAGVSGENFEPRALQDFYRNLAKALDAPPAAGASPDSYTNLLEPLMNPATWVTAAGGENPFGESVAGGGDFAEAKDFTSQFSAGNEHWSELNASTHAYQEVILAAWTRAGQEFMAAVKEKQAAGEEVGSWRELMDIWRTVANTNLLEMQRSDDYLAAQREFFRAIMKYRLQEQKLAETACESMNLPTRSELDEVHRTVTGLRRELRALQREMADLKRAAGVAPAPATATASAKAKAGAKPQPAPNNNASVTPKTTSRRAPRGSK